ncbi:MAG: hypothetical protein KTR30_15290 [Saprospiraceae bacterium]|nr:hypothetical protein [Saprospiraceae bacterium]
MKEFLLFIRTQGNPIADLSLQEQQEHVEKVGKYIQEMIAKGKMKDAQPLEMAGAMLSYQGGKFTDGPFNESKEVIAGYYHLIAEDLTEAIEIAKADPRFEDGVWRMEIRPILLVDGINAE